jgi:sugar lactone lactonase YvrE
MTDDRQQHRDASRAIPFAVAPLVALSLFARPAAAQTITTVAGGAIAGFCGDGGPATSACLNGPKDVAVDGAGNVFVADTNNNRIRRVDGSGTITTVAGNGTAGFCGDGGPATSACLDNPEAVAVDAAGNVFIADLSNNRIRRVDGSGTITTVAGNGTAGFCGDGGPATSACLNNPTGVAVDSAGNLFIAEYYNARVRRVTTAGVISTYAGTGSPAYCGDGGPAVSACVRPWQVAGDLAGNLYLADYGTARVRKVDLTGTITTVAGGAGSSYCGDGGPATSACLVGPQDVAVDPAGNLFIDDSVNKRIRKVDLTATITTFAGDGTSGHCSDGSPATGACLKLSAGVDLDAAANLLIADASNGRVYRVDPPPTGTVLTNLTLKKPIVAGCKPMTGTVTLSAPAPAGGITVSLSETLASGSVPATLTIPAGATSKTFKVTTTARADSEDGTVSASYAGVTLSKPLRVRPISVLSIPITPTTLVGGGISSGVVKLECKAAPGPILVEFGSTLPGVASATVPNVLIAAGVQTGPVTVTTSPVTTTKKPKITASANGLTKSKTLTVTP